MREMGMPTCRAPPSLFVCFFPSMKASVFYAMTLTNGAMRTFGFILSPVSSVHL